MYPRPICALVLLWMICLGNGVRQMLRYDLTAAPADAPARRWPSATSISHDASRPTLVLFLHPRCPCSRATLTELDRIMAVNGNRLALRIVLVRPEGTDDAWESGDLRQRAEMLPGAVVLSDSRGTEAERFGARASGHALMYAPDGGLLFQGGLTAARGHEGDSAGRAAVLAVLSGESITRRETPVFGCPLFNH